MYALFAPLFRLLLLVRFIAVKYSQTVLDAIFASLWTSNSQILQKSFLSNFLVNNQCTVRIKYYFYCLNSVTQHLVIENK